MFYIQTPFESDPNGALIEFATNREAYAAYSSPEAILGNRFIKMFWHKKDHEKDVSSETFFFSITLRVFFRCYVH